MCERCEELEERVAWLESELGVRDEQEQLAVLEFIFGLSGSEARVLRRLYGADGHLVTLAQLDEACPGEDAAGERDIKIIRVFVSRIRHKAGLAVESVWGRGYRLPPSSLNHVRNALATKVAA